MAEEFAAQFVYIAPLVIGAVIGFFEVVFVHSDEPGMNWLIHGLHAIPSVIVFTFLTMNISFVFSILHLTFTSNLYVDLGIRIAIGLLAALKVKAAAAITKGSHDVGEHLIHAILIGALIVAAPYIWKYVGPFLPAFLQR